MALIPISELPIELSESGAVDLCYAAELSGIADALSAQQSVLVECDKLLVTHVLRALRRVLRARPDAPILEIVDSRMDEGEGAVKTSLRAFRQALERLTEVTREQAGRGTVVAVPSFDLIVSGDQTGHHVDMMAREVMAVLYENPEMRVLGFKDPNLSVPKALAEFFSRRIEVFGISRVQLPSLVAQDEARRLDAQHFDPYRLYKYVSGLNAVKFRRIMGGFRSSRYVDGQPDRVLRELRRATMTSAEAALPNVSMDSIGGYDRVKRLLRDHVIGLLQSIEERATELDEDELALLERLVPRNILLTGPPGTGKTLFCKALATELNATVIVVNGPELKSMWVGESEHQVRKLFAKARKCAPSLIVFDEIDSIGGKRGGDQRGASPSGGASGGGSSHSMLNQLLTEMDGFRQQESVFVVGTTNFASALDDALRSRFRYEIGVPYPERGDRREILAILDAKYGLQLSPAVVERLLDETEAWIDQSTWTRFAGRDLDAVASTLGRERLFEARRRDAALADVAITPEVAAQAVQARIRQKLKAVGFDEIGGYAEVKQRLREEILDMLVIARDAPPEEAEQIEEMVPKGVIFEGPPGTGKTMFAKALAHELKATVSVIAGPELKSMWYGETERKVREAFEQARANAPSVLVFDEIDSIAGDRGRAGGAGYGSGVDRGVVNQLLTEMDGFRAEELVFVVATTNFAESLDQALRRPGRFEYVIHVGYPDDAARRAILQLYDAKYRLGLSPETMDHLVFRTDGWVDIQNGVRYSGDHLEAICRGIRRQQLRQPGWQPTIEHLDPIVAQRTKKPLVLIREEEEVIAAHEAGHAMVSLHLEGCAPVRKISIASEYDGSLGYVLHGEAERQHVQDERQLRAQIVCLMGGRVGERRVFGRVASGGADDIQKATLIATHLVASYGMDSEVGPRMVLHPLVHGDAAAGATSPELLAAVEKQVAQILREAEQAAAQLLEQHAAEYDQLRARLLEEKTVEFRD